MNNRMYLNPATQANLELLRARGVTVIPPGEGELASHGEHGIGRLPEPAELLEACEALLRPPSLKGLRVLVTAGGTREPIDSVRFVGNRSSGRMGYALAREAARRGAAVTVIAANVGLETPARVRVVPVRTAAELATAVRHEVAACDVLLMSAAVADFRPAGAVDTKLKKDGGVPKLELEPTEDVLNALVDLRRAGSDDRRVRRRARTRRGGARPGQARAQATRRDRRSTTSPARDIGFDSDDNEVTILAADGAERHVPRTRKDRVAEAVLDEVERLRTTRGGTDGARADTRSPARV